MYLKAIKREKYAKSSTILKKCARVYDKKLLDYANQFIDETIDENGEVIQGATDWNGNSQIPINEWTRYTDGKRVHNAVAYGWGNWDNVDTFNSELTELRTTMVQKYQAIQPQPQYITDWINENTTAAPKNDTSITDDYYNYIFPAFEVITSSNIEYYNPKGTLWSIPGFATYAAFGDETKANIVFKDEFGLPLRPNGGILDAANRYKNWSSRLGKVSSGTDCSGFVSRCTYLSEINGGCTYKINDLNYDLTEEKEGTSTLVSDNYSWEIQDYNLIVPGDMIIKQGHVAFVLAVDFPENSRDLGADYLSKVKIIHSTSGTPRNIVYRIKADDKWEVLGNTYKARRLIIE